MPIYLKQSTASQEVPLGPFVSSTDGFTNTGPTIANTDIKIWKYGATALVNKNSGGATGMSNGMYYAVLDATDTNTLGSLVIVVQVSGSLPVRVECVVLAANVYESMINNTEWLETTSLRADFSISSNTLTVKAKDGAMTQYTQTLTTDAAAVPIVGAS